jgi:hypothetical protein
MGTALDAVVIFKARPLYPEKAPTVLVQQGLGISAGVDATERRLLSLPGIELTRRPVRNPSLRLLTTVYRRSTLWFRCESSQDVDFWFPQRRPILLVRDVV